MCAACGSTKKLNSAAGVTLPRSRAPPISTMRATLRASSGAWAKASAGLVKGPSRHSVRAPSSAAASVSSRKATAWRGCAAMVGGFSSAPARPSPPQMNSAVRNVRSRGLLAPRKTGTSGRPASSTRRNALAVVRSTGTLPATVVMPRRSRCATSARASRMATASSWPGSVSMMIGVRVIGLAARAWRSRRPQTLAGHHQMGEVIGGQPVDRQIGDLAAVLEHRDATRHADDVGHVVADQDHRGAAAIELANELEDAAALGDAERGGRLVHDDETGAPAQRAGDRHRLALAAGETLDRAAGIADIDLDTGKIVARLRHHPALVEDIDAGDETSRQLGADEDVLPDRQPRGEGEILVDRRHPGGQRRARRGEVDRLPVELEPARARRMGARDDADQGRFAGTVVAADGDDLARRDVEIDALQGRDGAVGFADAGEAQERRHFIICSTLPASTRTASIQR